MAGNTKLMGFTPQGEIELERWGDRTKVYISEKSLYAIRKACYAVLPKKPKEPVTPANLKEIHVEYDETTGRIKANFSIGAAERLVDYTECDEGLATLLREAVVTHRMYLEHKSEPGCI